MNSRVYSGGVGDGPLSGDAADGDGDALGEAGRIGLTGDEVERLDVVGGADEIGLEDRGDAVFQEILISGGGELAGVVEDGLVLRRLPDALKRGECHRGEETDDDDDDHYFDEGEAAGATER